METKTLGYILLNILANEGPMSGYGLAAMLQPPAARFWYATHSQIYPELKRLLDDNLVAYEVEEQDGRPNKKVYTMTDNGREVLHEWLTSPTDITLDRDEFMMKVYGIWMVNKENAIALLREHERHHRDYQERYEAFMETTKAEWMAAGQPTDTPDFGRYVLLKRMIPLEREYADWCGWVAGLLEGNSRL